MDVLMGKLIVGPGFTEAVIDDRELAHLKVVILSKLRRGESFPFSWKHGADTGGGGRSTIWLHPSLTIEFRFQGSRNIDINRAWIDQLLAASNSSAGLSQSTEPAPPGTVGAAIAGHF
ncbi:MAG: ATP-dependent ligase [Microbacteriaceae bacterium]|jgi:hypothetical protein|nr:ATP-dependent ligase [Microbacteriaceae bacterium]